MYRVYDNNMDLLTECESQGRYLFPGTLTSIACYIVYPDGTKHNIKYVSNWRPNTNTGFILGDR